MITSLSILGSTGSIGTQTLEVARHLGISVAGLSAGRNIGLLEQQVRFFHPSVVSVEREKDACILKENLQDYSGKVEILHGKEGNLAIATLPEVPFVMAAMVGVAGLLPVMAALAANKTVGLANKETLVAGGDLGMPMVMAGKGRLHPVDSEHSAIWQCLMGTPHENLDRILLTASGGPFRGWDLDRLDRVTIEEALNHPTWRMGGKITIDSATMMNKGLEVIEAAHLFNLPVDRIDVVVHPQSIIHSMVRLSDGSVLGQLGFPDMRMPIQLAMTYPERIAGFSRPFDPFAAEACTLTFEKPDMKTYRLLGLAYEAARHGGTMPTVMNAANEVAVARFLSGEIGFTKIAGLVERMMEEHEKQRFKPVLSLETLLEADHEARQRIKEYH